MGDRKIRFPAFPTVIDVGWKKCLNMLQNAPFFRQSRNTLCKGPWYWYKRQRDAQWRTPGQLFEAIHPLRIASLPLLRSITLHIRYIQRNRRKWNEIFFCPGSNSFFGIQRFSQPNAAQETTIFQFSRKFLDRCFRFVAAVGQTTTHTA